MGKSTISMAIFHCYVKLPEGISLDIGRLILVEAPLRLPSGAAITLPFRIRPTQGELLDVVAVVAVVTHGLGDPTRLEKPL